MFMKLLYPRRTGLYVAVAAAVTGDSGLVTHRNAVSMQLLHPRTYLVTLAP